MKASLVTAAALVVTTGVVAAGMYGTSGRPPARLAAVVQPVRAAGGLSPSAQPLTRPVDLVARARHAAPATLRPRPARRNQPAAPAPTPKPTKPPRPHRPKPAPVRHLDFVIGTFNALGASHTAGGGTHARYASGSVRGAWAGSIVKRNDASVVGFQELQAPQLHTFMRSTGGSYAAFPGLSMGALNSENSIVWRTDSWMPVQRETFSIPYFGGHPRLMPAVLLANRATGLEAWFVNVHNPADTQAHPHQERFRNRAMSREIGLVNRLKASGLPVFFTGDLNERDLAFCRFTGEAGMTSASGGSHRGACLPHHPEDVDWIFAADTGRSTVAFSGYRAERDALVRRTTDHFVPFSQVEISGR